MKRVALVAFALCVAAAGAETVEYPTGTVTRTYTGTATGTVAGVAQVAPVMAEITGRPEDWAAETGALFTVRGRFVEPPVLAGAVTGWSHVLAVVVTSYPFRADADWEDGTGRVAAVFSPDRATITLEATGSVIGLAVELRPAILSLSSTVTNVAPPVVVQPPTSNAYPDAIDVSKVRIVGKHKMDPSRAEITRELHSARKQGGVVRLSFERLGWPQQGDSKICDGGVCILWADGAGYVGGFFDHHGVGQTVKTLGNVYDGYVDGRQPQEGAPVWFYLISYDGRQRTNIKPGGEWK